MKYVELDSAIENVVDQMRSSHSVICMVERLRNMETADVVARDCFDRILKENDIMRQQLAEVGKKPGDAMYDVYKVEAVEAEYVGRDEYWGEWLRCSACGADNLDCSNYCSRCGRKLLWI